VGGHQYPYGSLEHLLVGFNWLFCFLAFLATTSFQGCLHLQLNIFFLLFSFSQKQQSKLICATNDSLSPISTNQRDFRFFCMCIYGTLFPIFNNPILVFYPPKYGISHVQVWASKMTLYMSSGTTSTTTSSLKL
jgi:hypothetical protein